MVCMIPIHLQTEYLYQQTSVLLPRMRRLYEITVLDGNVPVVVVFCMTVSSILASLYPLKLCNAPSTMQQRQTFVLSLALLSQYLQQMR